MSFTGSSCAPDKATFNAENHVLQCATAGLYKGIASWDWLILWHSFHQFGGSLSGSSVLIHSLAGLERVSAARGHNCAPLFALSPAWEHKFLFSFHGLQHSGCICPVSPLDHDDIFDYVQQNN